MKKSNRFTPEECIAAYMAVTKCAIIPEVMRSEIIAKIFRNSDFPRPKKGRPKKSDNQSIDTQRANVIEHFRNEYPDINSDTEAIEFAIFTAEIAERLVEPEFRDWLPSEYVDEINASLAEGDGPRAQFTKLFGNMPPTGTILQSISRGRRKTRKP